MRASAGVDRVYGEVRCSNRVLNGGCDSHILGGEDQKRERDTSNISVGDAEKLEPRVLIVSFCTSC
jgi:hypothetical protein